MDDELKVLLGQIGSTASDDQATASYVTMARQVSAYHAALIEGGLNEDVALELTVDLSASIWRRVFWPDCPPS